jgi:ferredoxin
MENTIYFYSGTGNSLWIARTIARGLGDTRLVSIADVGETGTTGGSGVVGLVFPVYIWGLPRRIIRFAQGLKRAEGTYVFAAAVNGGQVSGTLVQLRRLLKREGTLLSAGFDIPMPSNYIPWGGPGPEKKRRERFEAASRKIDDIVSCVKKRERRPVEKGPLWARAVFTPFYRLTLSKVPTMDRQFWVDDKCNGCGVCSRVCPSDNIGLDTGRPIWKHRCEQCLSCLQWCPKEAVQYGKKTPGYERYHHPEVHLKDVLKPHPIEEFGSAEMERP